MLEVSLRVLERSALTSRSLTTEEAALRAREAENVLRFVDRARQIRPRGQVVLAGRESVMETLLGRWRCNRHSGAQHSGHGPRRSHQSRSPGLRQ